MANEKKIRKPKITSTEVTNEISKRLGLKQEMVKKVIDAYGDIVYQCLLNKIQVPFYPLGTFSFNVIPPRDHVEWRCYYNAEGEPIVFYQDKVDGYIKPSWSFGRTWAVKLKDNSRIPYGTMPSEEGIKVPLTENDLYMNYDDYVKEYKPERYENAPRYQEDIENTEDTDTEEAEIDEYEDWFNV